MATYELRTYHATTGRLQDLLDRYKSTTVGMLPDFGIELIGHWFPQDEPDTFVYIVRHAGDPEDAWQRFVDDPRWTAAVQATEQDGPLLRELTSIVLTPTELSPLR